jgi:hypothetical protein
MEDAKLGPYVVRRQDDGLEFVPSSILAVFMLAGFGAGAAVFLCMSIYFFQQPQMLFGPILLLAGCLIAAMAIRAGAPAALRSKLRVEAESATANTNYAPQAPSDPSGSPPRSAAK